MTSTLYSHPERHTYLDRSIRDAHHNLILDHLLERFGIRAGALVVEVGAGSGRFTEMLLARRLRVVAVEPDAVLAEKLKQRLGSVRGLELRRGTANNCTLYPKDLELVCGFHVLHHIDDSGLRGLGNTLRELWGTRERLGGWFFLEPNPLNVLYPIGILLREGMSLAEEKGIWRSNFQELLAPQENSVTLGSIGLFPPRNAVSRLPGRLLRVATRLSRRRSLVRAYTIYGAMREDDEPE